MRQTKLIPFLILVCLLAACSSMNNPTQAIDVETPTVEAPIVQTIKDTPTWTPTTISSATPMIITATPTLQVSAIPENPLVVYFIDVDQGDAILLQDPNGRVVLIDGGDADSGILPFLQSQNINGIDLMIATDLHADHIGGLVQVLNTMPVSRVVINGQISASATFEHFLDGIVSDQAAFSIARRGDTLGEGLMNFSVLNPVSINNDDTDMNSLVLRLDYGDVSFLFMGDAGQATEAAMIASGLVQPADILKVGNHGSGTSSSPDFLALVHPSVAIYFAGRGNTYGYPGAITLTNLAVVGSEVFGTDVNGTIIITTDGTTYRVNITNGVPRMPALLTSTP
jgi:competence protein ComEC